MSLVEETPSQLDSLPLFPLPHGALLPGELLPLHIFEPRYRRMLDVVRGSDHLIAIATILVGCDALDPLVSDIVGVGRVVRDRRNDDGTSDIVLHGLVRGEILNEVGGEPFRRAQVLLAPGGRTHPAEAYRLRRRLLNALAGRLRKRQLSYDVTAAFDPGALVDRIATSLELQPLERITLLQSVEVGHRIEALLSLLDHNRHRKRLADVVPSLHSFGLQLHSRARRDEP